MATLPYYVHNTNLSERNKYTPVVGYGGQNKRYFSNVECEFYFGSKRFYDMVNFSFSVEEVPHKIYGYNSFSPSLVVPGRKEINGEFRINFLEGGGFIKFLKTVESSVIENKMYNSITYCPDSSPTWGGADKTFDILIGYGYYKNSNKTYNATCQSLLGVSIIGYRQELDTTGEPITEVYAFTAKNYIEKDFESLNDEPNKKDDKKKEKEPYEKGPKYKVAERMNKDDRESLEEMCKNHDKTIGIICDVKHNLTPPLGASGEISVELELHNKNSLKIENVKLDILDQRVGSSTILKLNKSSSGSTKMYFKAPLSTDINLKIKNILKRGSQKKVQAKLQFSCKELNENAPIKNTVYIYPGDNY